MMIEGFHLIHWIGSMNRNIGYLFDHYRGDHANHEGERLVSLAIWWQNCFSVMYQYIYIYINILVGLVYMLLSISCGLIQTICMVPEMDWESLIKKIVWKNKRYYAWHNWTACTSPDRDVKREKSNDR